MDLEAHKKNILDSIVYQIDVLYPDINLMKCCENPAEYIDGLYSNLFECLEDREIMSLYGQIIVEHSQKHPDDFTEEEKYFDGFLKSSEYTQGLDSPMEMMAHTTRTYLSRYIQKEILSNAQHIASLREITRIIKEECVPTKADFAVFLSEKLAKYKPLTMKLSPAHLDEFYEACRFSNRYDEDPVEAVNLAMSAFNLMARRLINDGVDVSEYLMDKDMEAYKILETASVWDVYPALSVTSNNAMRM